MDKLTYKINKLQSQGEYIRYLEVSILNLEDKIRTEQLHIFKNIAEDEIKLGRISALAEILTELNNIKLKCRPPEKIMPTCKEEV